MKKLLVFFILFLFFAFYASPISATTIPYTITTGIPATPVILFETFFTTQLIINYQTGSIFLSSNSDGSGNTLVDDIVHLSVLGPDGRTRTFSHFYAPLCRTLIEQPPFDITDLFRQGENRITVSLSDGCGVFGSSTPLYLVNINAPDPTPTPAPTKTPLILIPGIGGSELKVGEDTVWSEDNGHGGIFEYTYLKDERVWINELEAAKPGNDDYFDVLRMKEDGITSEANIGLTENLVSRAYQEMIDYFTSNGYTLNQNLFIFPYDWRRNLTLTATLLDAKINQIKSQTGSEKVDIVSHSMGGLVARNYIADPQKAQNIRKLFTLGTPHLGSTHFLKVLRYGDCLTSLPVSLGPFCLGVTYSEVKDVIQNMIGGYELAPSRVYFNIYSGQDNSHPYPYADLSDIDNNGITGALNYDQTKTLLTNLGHNTSLFTPSESFHNLDNNLSGSNGVEITNIVGSGIATLGQIIEKYTLNFSGIKIPHRDQFMINGDNTVPLLSASFSSENSYYTKQEHGNLVSSGPALNLVKNILNEDPQLPEGVSSQPYEFKGHGLSVHSPVNIHVYDSAGNHTGPLSNGDFEASIPGSFYDTLDDAKFIWLPEEGIYTINFASTNTGSFDFKIRRFENDENTETILYKEIPLTDTTEAETTFDTGSGQPPVIDVDADGNGTVDFNVEHFSILEGDANYDYTPPVISFNVNPQTIWPPNGKLVNINIEGNLIDDNTYLTTIIVDDEYNLVEPSITIENQTEINQIINLEAARSEEDQDGRKYTIRILAIDLAGNTSLATQEVIVPHDQGKVE